jgi:Protein of unknown function (DUF3604)
MKFRTIGSAVLFFALVASLSIVPAVAQEKNPKHNAYLGDEHIHTSWLLNAWIFGNRIPGLDDAYKFPNS